MVEKSDDAVLVEALWLLLIVLCMCVASCYFLGAGLTAIIMLVFCTYKYIRHRGT